MKNEHILGFKAGESKARTPVTQPDSASSKSFAHIVYGVAEGEIAGADDIQAAILLDSTPIKSASGEINLEGIEIDYRWGTNEQDHLPGFTSIVNEISYNNVELVSSAPYVVYLNNTELDAVRLRLTWGKIYQANPENGDTNGYRIDYAIDIQVDGGGYQEVLLTALDDKVSSGYERSHRLELPPAEDGWEIRIRRLTANQTSDHIGDKMYLAAVAEIIDAKLRYPNTALIGLKFDADRFKSIPKVDFRLKGKIIRVPSNYNPVSRTYATTGEGTTNGVWNGQFKLAYSNNPAWVFYDVCLNKRYGLGDRIDASMMDKWALYNIARYCDVMVPDGEGGTEPRFACNVYINSKLAAFDCLNQLSGIFRGFMHWNGSAIVVNSDQPSDPIFTYTRANVIGEFNYSGTRARDRHSIAAVAFDDPKNGFKTDKEVVSDHNAISELGVRVLDLAAFACTSRGQAQRVGRSALLKEQMETRLVTFAVGLDGYIPVTGRIVEIADPLLAGRAIGGRIAQVSGSVITLDRITEAKVGDRLAVNGEDGVQESRQVIGVSGKDITVATPFTSVAAENVWALESEDLQLMKFLVLSVTENRTEEGVVTFSIAAVQHEPQIQGSSDNLTYIEPPNYSVIDINTQAPVASVSITSENLINQGIDITNLVISWPQVSGAVRYQVEWRRDNGTWIKTPDQYRNDLVIPNIFHGVYQAKVIAVNAMDVESKPTLSALTPIESKYAEPPVLASIAAKGKLFGMDVNWSFPAVGSLNTAYTEIWVSYTADHSDEKKLGDYAYPLNLLELNGLQPHTEIWFKGRLVDKSGQSGDWSAWVSDVVTADPEALLEALNGHIGLAAITEELAQAIDEGVAAKAIADAAKQTADAASEAADSATEAAIVANNMASLASTNADAAKVAASNATTVANAAHNAADQAASEASEAKQGVAEANTLINDALTAIVDERAQRISQITALDDGLTQLNAKVIDGDTILQTNIDNLKSSTTTSLSNIQTNLTTLTDADTAQASRTDAIDARLTGLSGVVDTKASASALNETNVEVNRQNGILTGHTSQLTNLNSAIADANANLTNNYYTKSQADIATAGQVTNFAASLNSTGVNLVTSITSRTDKIETGWTVGSNLHTVVQGAGYVSTENAYKFKINHSSAVPYAVIPRTISPSPDDAIYVGSAYIKSPIAKKVSLRIRFYVPTSGGGYTPRYGPFVNIDLPPNEWVRIYAAGMGEAGDSSVAIHIMTNLEATPIGDDNYVLVSRLMIERAYSLTAKPSPWVEGIGGVGKDINANANAITSTNTEVSRINGVVLGQSTQLTNLTTSINVLNGKVNNKADAAALEQLSTKVTSVEGKVTTEAAKLLTLEGSVNDTKTNLTNNYYTKNQTTAEADRIAAGRVDALSASVDGKVNSLNETISNVGSVVDTMETRIDNTETTQSTHTSQITQLNASLSAVEGTISTKADATALNTTNAEVSRVNGEVIAQTNRLTELNSKVDNNQAYIVDNFYTKAGANDAISGQITQFKAGLSVGGKNLLKSSNVGGSKLEGDTAYPFLTYGMTDALKHATMYTLVVEFEFNKVGENASFTPHFGGMVNFHGTAVSTARQVMVFKAYQGHYPTGDQQTLQFYIVGADPDKISSSATVYWAALYEGDVTLPVMTWQPSVLEQADAIAANAQSIISTNAEVARVNGEVVGHASQLIALDTTVAGNRAEMINNYYTKTQANIAMAGEVSNFKASLSVGGVNLLNNYDMTKPANDSAWNTNGGGFTHVSDPTYGTVVETVMPSGIVHDYIPVEDNTVYTYSARVRSTQNWWNYVSTPLHWWALDADGVNDSQKYIETLSLYPTPDMQIDANVWTTITVTFRTRNGCALFRPFLYGINGIFHVARTQLEKGSLRSDWTPSIRDTNTYIGTKADASALTATNAEVTRVGNELVATANQLTDLRSTVNANNAHIIDNFTTKADMNSALSEQATRLTAEIKSDLSDNVWSLTPARWVNEQGTGEYQVTDASALSFTVRPLTFSGNSSSYYFENLYKDQTSPIKKGEEFVVVYDIKTTRSLRVDITYFRAGNSDPSFYRYGDVINENWTTFTHKVVATEDWRADLSQIMGFRLLAGDGWTTDDLIEVRNMRVTRATGGIAQLIDQTKANATAISNTKADVTVVDGKAVSALNQLTELSTTVANNDSYIRNNYATKNDTNTAIANATTHLQARFNNIREYTLVLARNGDIAGAGLFNETGALLGTTRGLNLIIFNGNGDVQEYYAYDTYGDIENALWAFMDRLRAINATDYFLVYGTDNIGNIAHMANNNWAYTSEINAELVLAGADANYIKKWSSTDLPVFIGRKNLTAGSAMQDMFISPINNGRTKIAIRFVGGVPDGVGTSDNRGIDSRATASALTDLTTHVSQIDGTLTSYAQQFTQLNASLAGVTNTINENLKDNKGVVIDLSAYYADSWYPVGIGSIPTEVRSYFSIHKTLDGIAKPAWASHDTGGFSMELSWNSNGGGWGTAEVYREIEAASYAWVHESKSPFMRIGQQGTRSTEVVWLRGGTVYNASVPRNASIHMPMLSGELPDGNGSSEFAYDTYATVNIPKPTVLKAQQQADATANALSITNAEVARVNGVATSASSRVDQLTTTVSGHSTTIQQHTQSINGVAASYTVKINNNGYTTGFGLISTGTGGQPSTAFKVDADAFEVGKTGLGIKPFVVITSPNQVINGITYPYAGTYINAAYISYATINNAHIRDLAVTTAKIADGQITTAKIGDLQVDTIKIKDNAVTVPEAVVLLNPISRDDITQYNPTVFSTENAKLEDTANFFGDILSITIQRSGGKCRVEGTIGVTNLAGSTWRQNGTYIGGVANRIYVGTILYKNGVAVAHARVPVHVQLLNEVAIFNGHVNIPLYVDPPMTGQCTFTVRVGLSTNVDGGGSLVVRGYGGQGGTKVVAASLATLELKK